MASRLELLSAQRRRRASKQKDHGKRPRGIEKKEPRQVRRSARLEDISWLQKTSEDRKPGRRNASLSIKEAPPSPPASNISKGRIIPNPPSKIYQKRKRVQETGHSSPRGRDRPPSKRFRTMSPNREDLRRKQSATARRTPIRSRLGFRAKRGLANTSNKTARLRKIFLNTRGTNGAVIDPGCPSDTSLTGSSNQKKREGKIAPYRDNRYTMLLAAKGSYMRELDDYEIPKNIKDLCQTLLERDQTVPRDSLFRDDLFKRTCREIEDRNEAIIIQDIARLIVPSVKTLAIHGAKHLDHLIENVDEGWTEGIPVEGPRPQPDYSVGFRRSAFTDEQLNRFDPLIGSVYDTSFFVATYRMYLPFLTCEVKCGAAALDIADRQNAHSMTLAVRGVVELFRLVKREKELHREILAFSISHDHATVRIYGHYPVIDGNKTTFYRHPIHKFDFTALDGKEKWTAYKFTKNVYDVWMPTHLKRFCSAIEQLPPDMGFDVSQGSELQFTEASGLSQELGGLLTEQSKVEPASRASQDGSELALLIPHTDTPDTSLSQGKDQAALKRPKRKHTTK